MGLTDKHIGFAVRRSVLPLLLCVLLGVMAAGCSDSAKPDNPEPTIELFDATEVGRTEAVISARVRSNGGAGLTHISFYYGTSSTPDREVQPDDATAAVLTCRLTGLNPGTTYSWCVVGGTATATIRSNVLTFSTLPNERPVVSPLVVLSTGPVGLVASFDIADDGGEPVLTAGCEIQNTATGAVSHIYLPSDALAVGMHRLHIGGLALSTSYTITPFAANSIGEGRGEPLEFTTRESIVLDEAGMLPALFEGSEGVDMAQLTISGPANGTDFRFLRMLLGAPLQPGEQALRSKVYAIDLSDAAIVGGGEPYDGYRHTVADELTTGIFAGCVRLRQVVLPASATVLARDAFADCTALESLTLAAEIRSVVPSAGCTALRAIEVSEANTHYKAIDGVLFDADATALLWFPLGKSGDYALPPTVAAIGEAAFAGTSITGLVIPPSVTSIARGAFAGSALREISLPDNLANVSEGMFQNCASLATVHLGAATERVGGYAFAGTALTDLYITATIPPYTTAETFAAGYGAASVAPGCTLHVPAGCRKVYANHARWGAFGSIVEF